jgi:hypothetical protein
MLNCVAAIQFDEETQKFVLVSGNNRIEIRKTKALKKFVKDSPEISLDIIAALKDQWFPDAEYQGIMDQADVVLDETQPEVIEHAAQ